MKIITTDLCAYCLSKATTIRKTQKYQVGLCDKHKYLKNKEIDEIISDEEKTPPGEPNKII